MANRELDGCYLLKVPFSEDQRAARRHILRIGVDVHVLAPEKFRAKVQNFVGGCRQICLRGVKCGSAQG